MTSFRSVCANSAGVGRRVLGPACVATALLCGSGCGNDPSTRANDFSLQVTPAAQTVTLSPDGGTTATFTVTTAVTSGVAESVALGVSGLPGGISGTFAPASLAAAGTSTLTLAVGPSAAAATTTFAVSGTAASKSHSAAASIGVCIPGPVTLAVTEQATYNCQSPAYKGTFTVTNGSCAPVTVTQVVLTGTTDPTVCSPSGVSTYNLSPAVTVGVGAAVDVLPLTGGPYCCASSPCAANMPACVETYNYRATTSAGTLTADAGMVTINLAGCATGVDGGPGYCPP